MKNLNLRYQWRKIQHHSLNTFRLILAWTSTVHKVQGLSLEQGDIDFDLRKQKSFGPGQIYLGLSWVKTYDTIYCIGEFDKSEIKANKDALFEYERPKQNNLLYIITRNNVWDDAITIFAHNAESLSKHIHDVVSDNTRFFYKKDFYKKMSLKNLKTLRKC